MHNVTRNIRPMFQDLDQFMCIAQLAVLRFRDGPKMKLAKPIKTVKFGLERYAPQFHRKARRCLTLERT